LRGELPPLVSPDIARDFVYVEDVCRAYVLAASTPRPEQGAVYNVGTGVQTTMAEVVDLARNALGIEAKPEWSSMADRQWDARTWVADSRKIKRELGWRPQCDFAEGFRRTAEWFGEHGDLLPANL
jgi:dolichol-phosphate mannosyltransferase